MRNFAASRARIPPGELPFRPAEATSGRRTSSIVIWLCLIGALIPAGEVQLYVADAKFTAGRLSILLLLLPAIIRFVQDRRRLFLCDFFAAAASFWLVGAAVYTSGVSGLNSAGAVALEFLGAFIVGRAFIVGPDALSKFARVLKFLSLIIITLGIFDIVSGRPVVHQTLASLLNVPTLSGQLRTFMGVTTVRAMSTFDHSILFGTFCVVVALVAVYSEKNMVRRILWLAFCGLGVVIGLSSAPLLGLCIAVGAFFYDSLMKAYSWRWKIIWWGFGLFIATVVAVTNNPLGWLISHFTLEPESGYFRIMEWDLAIYYIMQAPFVGYPIDFYFGNLLDVSIDCVWLVFAVRAGLPMIVFLFLANVAACLPTRRRVHRQAASSYMDGMRIAFSIILFEFVFIGLTVHFWNYAWILWGLCLGIRASLRENSSVGRQPAYRPMGQPFRADARWA